MGTTLQPAGDNPPMGVGSGDEVMPRRIPEVSIRLDKTIKTKIHNNFVIRDMLPTTMRAGSLLTGFAGEYEQHFTKKDAPNSQNQNKIYVPKSFVTGGEEPDFVTIGDYMVIRPEAVNQGTYITNSEAQAATADNSVDQAMRSEPQAKGSSSNYAWDATTNAGRRQMRNEGQTFGVSSVISRALLKEPSGAATHEKARVSLSSQFTLKRNQPFCVSFKADDHQFDPTISDYLNDESNWEGDTPPIPYAQFYPKNVRKQAAIEIEWGSSNSSDTDEFKVIFRPTGKNVTLWRKQDGVWRVVENHSILLTSNNDPWTSYIIYPAGRQLIIIPSDHVDSAAIKAAVVFSFDREVNIPSSKMQAHLYGTKMSYAWRPVIHRSLAGMVTPPMEPGIPEIENAFCTLEFIGKKKFERDAINAPTKFPKDESAGLADEDSSFGELDLQIVDQKELLKQNKTKEEAFDLYEVGYQLLVEDLEIGLLGSSVKSQLPDDYVVAMEAYPDNKVAERKNYLKYAILCSKKASVAPYDLVLSPVFERMQLLAIAPMAEINLNPLPQITASDIFSVNVRQESQSVTGSFTLNNRFAKFDYVDQFLDSVFNTSVPHGRYDARAIPILGQSNFVGVKPVTIRFGIMGGTHFVSPQLASYSEESEDKEGGFDQPIQFRGYITSRSYSRSNSGSSTVTCNLEDVSRRAKDHITMNLPIFDGWSNLAAMYYLARDAGYDDEDIVLYQSPKNPDDYITLYNILVELGDDPHTFTGPSFSGHVNGFPLRSKILDAAGITMSMSVLHSCMPLNLYKQQPNYMFSAGQNTWDCMASIREFTGFYLYPNAFGKLVYSPPEIQFKLAAKPPDDPKTTYVRGAPQDDLQVITYYESPQNPKGVIDGSEFNNFQMHLENSYQTENIRNALALFGLIPHADNQVQWSPHIVVKRPEDLSEDIAQPWFVPWLRWAIIKNPHWADPVRNERLAEELFNRLKRTMISVTFGLWGQPGHYAWQRFIVDESQMQELGIDGLEFVTTMVEHRLDAQKKTYNTEIAGEYLDFKQFDFAPHVTGSPVRTYTPAQRRRPLSPVTPGPRKLPQV